MSLPVSLVGRHRLGSRMFLRIVSCSISCFDPRVSSEPSWPRLGCSRHDSPLELKNSPIIVERYDFQYAGSRWPFANLTVQLRRTTQPTKLPALPSAGFCITLANLLTI